MQETYDVIILGSGPAGLTAAIYTARSQLRTLVLEAGLVGGNAAVADIVDNYPGFPFGVQGQQLMEDFQKQAERFGARVEMDQVLAVKKENERFIVQTQMGEYITRCVIVTVGARRKKLEVPGEDAFLGRGVSYCATCDGPFFRQMTVAVVGGGETAVKEALYLSQIAAKVYLIHRREQFRTIPAALDKIRRQANITVLPNQVIKKIAGGSVMEEIVLENTSTGEKNTLPVEGIFISIGMVPAADVIEGLPKTDSGYIEIDANMQTSVPGIFAAGDVCQKQFRQIATAVGDGAAVGMAVIEYLGQE